MTAAARTTAGAHTTGAASAAGAPYRAGDRAQILYTTERGTILADAHITEVHAHDDGSYGVHAIVSDARTSFRLVPAAVPARSGNPVSHRGPGHVIYGVDHTHPTE